MKKLRRGQDITSELINELIDELEELKSQHKQAELDKTETEQKLSEFDSRMTTWEESYSSALEALPDLPAVLQMYADARAGFVNELDNDTPIISSTSAVTIGYLTQGESYIWTDDNGNGSGENAAKFTGESGYYWGIISNGVTTYHTKEPARGPQGAMGPAGVQGQKGDTGAIGARGPQGAQGQTGASGRTPRLTFAFADNIQGKNAVTEANANKRFIGIKVYYEDEDQSTIASRPYTWYQAQGITYYPQIDEEGYLTFSENIPANTTGRYKIKGEKGEKGDPGSAPAIILKYTDNENTEQFVNSNVRISDASKTVDSDITYTFDLDVLKNTTLRGVKGDPGEDGAQGPKGETGEPGYLKGTLQYKDSNDDWATVEGATGLLYKNGLPYTEAKEGEAYLIGDTGKVVICTKVQSNGCVFKYIGGVRGPKGDKGDTGSTGPQGEKGATGDTGKAITNIKTRLLANGETEVQLMMSDGSDATFNLPQGPQGVQGERGPQGPAGTSVKIKENQAAATDIGDAYIDSQGRICIRVANSGDNQFTTGAQIRGPKGDAVFMRTYTANNVTYIQYALADESTLIENIPSNKWVNIIETGLLKGPQGVAAGFASPEATYDTSHDSEPDNTRTPAVSVTTTGNNTDKKFSFTFSGLKGPQGIQGPQGPAPLLESTVNHEVDSSNTTQRGLFTKTSSGNEPDKYQLTLYNLQGAPGTDGAVPFVDETANPPVWKLRYADGTVTNTNIPATNELTIDNNGYWCINGNSTNVKATGNGISSITGPTTNGNIDTYTINFTDGGTKTFNVTHGSNGYTPEIVGNKWYINGVDQGVKAKGEDGNTWSTGETNPFDVYPGNSGDMYLNTTNGKVYQCNGGKNWTEKCIIKGDTGTSVSSITKTSTSGLVDTYTITLSNGNTTTFNVTNGAKGDQGDPGDPGTPGTPGTSCTHSWNGTTLTITSASGTTSADLKGPKGDGFTLDNIGTYAETSSRGFNVATGSSGISITNGGFSDAKILCIYGDIRINGVVDGKSYDVYLRSADLNPGNSSSETTRTFQGFTFGEGYGNERISYARVNLKIQRISNGITIKPYTTSLNNDYNYFYTVDSGGNWRVKCTSMALYISNVHFDTIKNS